MLDDSLANIAHKSDLVFKSDIQGILKVMKADLLFIQCSQ